MIHEQGKPVPSDELNEAAELYEHHRFQADKGQAPLRIDKFLVNRLENASRNKIQAAASAGNILVNDQAVKSNYKVKPKDTITIVMSYPPREIEIIPQNIPLDICYEDDSLIVINKKAGMVVHPGYGNYTGTLVNALTYHLQESPLFKKGEERPGLVHRLDKDTSGVMVVAKTEFALNHLARQFYERTTGRLYQALVWGDVKEDTGTIRGNLARSLHDRKQMAVYEDPAIGKHAVTHYKVIQRFGYTTLVECKLETGRTHQIRAHMKHIGHTLLNDERYGGNTILKGTTFTKYKQFIQNCFDLMPRTALHARSLSFEHPTQGNRRSFESPIPPDMKQVLDKWVIYTENRKDPIRH